VRSTAASVTSGEYKNCTIVVRTLPKTFSRDLARANLKRGERSWKMEPNTFVEQHNKELEELYKKAEKDISDKVAEYNKSQQDKSD
jgi:hypothetical protein